MVVVVPEDLHDAGRSGQACVRADVDEVGAGCDEQVDEGLGQAVLDLVGSLRRPLSAISTRVVDVDVEAVLMRGVLGPEVAALAAAEIADADSRSGRVLARVPLHDRQHRADEVVRPPPPPGGVRRDVIDRVPGEKELGLGR
jgi:hypothetical protein